MLLFINTGPGYTLDDILQILGWTVLFVLGSMLLFVSIGPGRDASDIMRIIFILVVLLALVYWIGLQM